MGPVRHIAVDLHPTIHRTRMEDEKVLGCPGQALIGYPEDPIVLPKRRQEPGLHALELKPENIERVGPLDRVFDSGENGDAELLHVPWQQRRRSAHPHLGAELGQPPDITPGHSAVENVTTDGDLEALDSVEAIAESKHVEQTLRGMLVLAVSGVDHVGADSLSQELRRAR